MCGICGIVSRSGARISEAVIRTVNNLAAHRGPDAEGYFIGDYLAFGHRRLAIIDISEAGNQPMAYMDRYTITYNGEIYNYIELKKELIGLGYAFETQTDTEVILAAYECWGERCVSRFNGMWAFAIHDNIDSKIFCSRDRFGIKPFYYSEVGDHFVFGSEIKQVLELHSRNVANLPLLLDFLVLGLSEHTDETFFAGVNALPGGHNLTYDLKTHEYAVQQYYWLEANDDVANLSEENAVNLYRGLLENAVEIRLRSDATVGTCLSGGLDSSSIAAIAAKKYKQESRQSFKAITSGSTNPANDESGYAELVALESGLDWHLIRPSNDDFTKTVEELARVQEEPIAGPSLVMQYHVFREAKRLACKVMLDGQGGDETLLGYERYYTAYFCALPLTRIPGAIFLAGRNSRLRLSGVLLYIAYFLSSSVRKALLRKRNKFLKKQHLGSVRWEWIDKLSSATRHLQQLQQLEITSTQLPHLLRYEDRNSMAHSIESRLPFLDYRLVEAALGLQAECKIKNGWTKYVLRRAAESYLPQPVVWRRSKFGFEAPAVDWLRDNRKQIQDTIDNSLIICELTDNTKGLSDSSMWALFFVALWERAYDVLIE